MKSTNFEAELKSRIREIANLGVYATIALAVGDTRLTAFALADGRVRFDADLKADVTFVFDSAATALGIVTGSEEPIDAFMDGRFRADGHLPLAFVLLGLFRPGVDAAPPP
ncbi:MAG: hypothetical protein OXK76_14850 [Gammaproteobacteria bacterium]|nr:hypothetical protein [Gammaproteobacteria bacterium]